MEYRSIAYITYAPAFLLVAIIAHYSEGSVFLTNAAENVSYYIPEINHLLEYKREYRLLGGEFFVEESDVFFHTLKWFIYVFLYPIILLGYKTDSLLKVYKKGTLWPIYFMAVGMLYLLSIQYYGGSVTDSYYGKYDMAIYGNIFVSSFINGVLIVLSATTLRLSFHVTKLRLNNEW
jgi:hypothetical protein